MVFGGSCDAIVSRFGRGYWTRYDSREELIAGRLSEKVLIVVDEDVVVMSMVEVVFTKRLSR